MTTPMCCAPGGRCTLGGTRRTFLRSFRWGHVRQLDVEAGAPATDLDSTICPTRCATGDVLMSRLREGGQHRHFLRERNAGANGRLTLRADSGFYTYGVVSVCKMDVRFSMATHLIEAIPEDAHGFLTGPVAETTCTSRQADAAPVRLIVRRVKPTPGSQLAITASSPTGTGSCSNWRLTIAATPRSECQRDLKYGVGLNHLPSGRFAANGAWLAVQTMAHNLARWTARIGLIPSGGGGCPLGTPVDPASSGARLARLRCHWA